MIYMIVTIIAIPGTVLYSPMIYECIYVDVLFVESVNMVTTKKMTKIMMNEVHEQNQLSTPATICCLSATST